MVVVLLWVLVVQNMPEDLHEPLSQVLILVRILYDKVTDDAESGEHDRGFLVSECLDCEGLDLREVVLEVLVDVIEY